MKLIGVLIIILGLFAFRLGIKYKDSGGTKISNVDLIGGAILLFVMGVGFLLSDKTLCEIFNVFC